MIGYAEQICPAMALKGTKVWPPIMTGAASKDIGSPFTYTEIFAELCAKAGNEKLNDKIAVSKKMSVYNRIMVKTTNILSRNHRSINLFVTEYGFDVLYK